ncbi:MAG: cell division protein FtsL [Proteobacteria bacterium]|nr:cell division protein FtsL [Pseudomonadota bacterium]MCH8976146.1 cell division protein FtsL [Pseudomonadota bacterium]MCH9048641.1 cell division protein FtsL [Pseudomonadota bacterium]
MKNVFLILLGTAVFFSAIKVVIARHDTRRLFVEIQKLEKDRDNLNEEWGRLQLEQSTWATDARIESVSKTELHMIEPKIRSVTLISK